MANSVEMGLASTQRTQAPDGNSTSNKGIGSLLPVEGKKTASNSAVGLVERNSGTSNAEELSEAISRIQDYFQDTRRALEFRLDESTGITVVSVFDATTQELIRQIPNEEAVSLARKLNQEEPLSLFRAQV